MALIIKADMPVSCFGCEMDEFWKACPLHNMEEVELESWKDADGTHPSCPILGEISDEHGRLIDADALSNRLLGEGIGNLLIHRKQRLTVGDVRTIIENTPTVLEATE